MEFYGRNSATFQTFNYTQQIEKISVRPCGDSCVASQRDEGSGCEWNFIMNTRESGISLMLGREGRPSSFVGVRLSIVDCFGRSSLHAAKSVRFECSSHAQGILFLERDYLFSRYCGLNKLLYVPNDTLTLRWEITSYEYSVQSYDKKEAFENSSKSPGSFWRKGSVQCLLRFLVLWLLFVVAIAVAVRVLISVNNFFQGVVIPFLDAVAEFLAFAISLIFAMVVLATLMFICERSKTNQVRYTQVERRQIALPNRGVASYETVRSMSYNNLFPSRYNYPDRRNYRIQ